MSKRLKRLTRLGDILEPALKKLDISQKTKSSMVLFLWPKIVGERIARNARAERVRGKTLFVATRTSSWTTELTFLKAEIMRKIREEVGGGTIEDVRFSASGKTWEDDIPEEKEEDLRTVKIPGEVLEKIEEICSSIPEPPRSSFKNFLLLDARLRQWKLDRGWLACPLCGALKEKGEPCPYCLPRAV